MLHATFDWDEIQALIDLLYAHGVRYLMGSERSEYTTRDESDTVHLLQRLAGCHYPLVENATIALLILHPELAPSVTEALQRSEGEIRENLAVVTLATLYLQQWWLFRLTFALGHLPSFPETPFVLLWQERHLPPPHVGYGLDGLLALQDYQQHRYGVPLNFLDDWQNQITHLLTQEEGHQRSLSIEVREILLQLSA